MSNRKKKVSGLKNLRKWTDYSVQELFTNLDKFKNRFEKSHLRSGRHWIKSRLRNALKFAAELSPGLSELIIMCVRIKSWVCRDLLISVFKLIPEKCTHSPATICGRQHFVQILTGILGIKSNPIFIHFLKTNTSDTHFFSRFCSLICIFNYIDVWERKCESVTLLSL